MRPGPGPLPPPAGGPGGLPDLQARPVRRDRLFRQEADRLAWYAIVALGYEAGNWLKLAVTLDVDGIAKAGQSYHPEQFRVRVVRFTADRLFADMVRDEVLRGAEKAHQRLAGSCVAMSVGAATAAIEAAAHTVGVQLMSEAEWERVVDRRVRR